jgi:hypothetical protein
MWHTQWHSDIQVLRARVRRPRSRSKSRSGVPCPQWRAKNSDALWMTKYAKAKRKLKIRGLAFVGMGAPLAAAGSETRPYEDKVEAGNVAME